MKDMTIEELRAALDAASKTQVELANALKEKEAEEAELKKKKLAEEKEERRAALCAMLEETDKALREYIRDYGSFTRPSNNNDDFAMSYLFHNFLF